MFIRIWKARVAPESYEEYRKFEKQMMVLFQDHEGFLGIFFRQNGDICASLSLWQDERACRSVAKTAAHKKMLAELEESDLLLEPYVVTIFESKPGAPVREAFAEALGQSPPSA